MLFDDTINQHFISQVELRANTSTPSLPNKNKKIYAFDIDKKSEGEKVYKPKNVRIANNLLIHDLFTVNNEDSLRQNLERLFQNYETRLNSVIIEFERKISEGKNNISDELFSILSLKLLNSFRNPYIIKKTLNTIGSIGNYSPTSPELRRLYKVVSSGNKPQKEKILSLLNITEDEYCQWLRCLFMLLAVKIDKEDNILESMLENILIGDDSAAGVALYRYQKNNGILICDRGIIDRTETPGTFVFDININSRMFMRFVSRNIKSLRPENISIDFYNKAVDLYNKRPKSVDMFIFDDEMDILENYNQCAVLQAAHKVYCSTPKIHGVEVVEI